MLPSLLAKQLAPCFGTIQPEPLALGAGDALTYEGRALPNLPPTGLRSLLARPGGSLLRLQALRDHYLDRMHGLLAGDGTPAQRRYLDGLAVSRRQARNIGDALLDTLSGIRDDRGEGPLLAAVALIKMNVSPVVAVRIDFGGDNHSDPNLTQEVAQHASGVQLIARLMEVLRSQGLEDRVTFAMTNVFGRTLKKLGLAGRDHWASHHTTVMIGKGVRAGVVGGVEPRAGDYGCTAIDDIPVADTLGAMGKTLGATLGIPTVRLDAEITRGKVVHAALA
jgi:hypothetical protein